MKGSWIKTFLFTHCDCFQRSILVLFDESDYFTLNCTSTFPSTGPSVDETSGLQMCEREKNVIKSSSLILSFISIQTDFVTSPESFVEKKLPGR